MWYWSSYLKLQDAKKSNNMDNKSNEQFITMQATIESNRQESDEKMENITEDLK